MHRAHRILKNLMAKIIHSCVLLVTERPQHCSAHLLNSGSLVIGNDVIAEFNGTGPISHYTCFLDGRVFMERCE